jgi:hypothetical protein
MPIASRESIYHGQGPLYIHQAGSGRFVGDEQEFFAGQSIDQSDGCYIYIQPY